LFEQPVEEGKLKPTVDIRRLIRNL